MLPEPVSLFRAEEKHLLNRSPPRKGCACLGWITLEVRQGLDTPGVIILSLPCATPCHVALSFQGEMNTGAVREAGGGAGRDLAGWPFLARHGSAHLGAVLHCVVWPRR